MVLADSVKQANPAVKFMVCLLEREIHPEAQHYPNFDEILLSKDAGFPNFEQFIFKHSIVEASTAVKGQVFQYVLNTYLDEAQFVYLDPDIIVLSDMIELSQALNEHRIVLTPHLTIPEEKSTAQETLDAVLDNELCALQHGVYNLGFLAVRRSPEARNFIDWWASRLNMFCYDDIPRGIFTDQRWIDLAPCFFDVGILKHPGYNVAPWNLSMRQVTQRNGNYFANGHPLRFFHFSGFDSGANEAMVNKYVPDHSNPVWTLRDQYVEAVHAHGQGGLGSLPWSYDYFQSGEKIEGETRRMYREYFQTMFENPFQASNRRILGKDDFTALRRLSSVTLFCIEMINNIVTDQVPQPIRLPAADQLVVRGWAADKRAQQTAARVYLEIDGAIHYARYGLNRPDVADHFHVPAYQYSGFEAVIPVAKIGQGEHTLSLKIITHDEQAYYAPERQIRFEVP